MTLRFCARGLDDPHVAAGRLDQLGVVVGALESAAASSAARSVRARKTCGVWTAHRLAALERRDHPSAGVRLLDRVDRARRRDHAVAAPALELRRRSGRSARLSPAAARRRGRRTIARRRPPPARCATDSRAARAARRRPPRQAGRRLRATARELVLEPPGGAAITTASIARGAASAARHQATSGRPASSTSAFGRSAPRRSPCRPPLRARSPRGEPRSGSAAPSRVLSSPPRRAPALVSSSSSSRYSSASSSSMSSAYISSDERIFLARVNICFSPVERPFWKSRIAEIAHDLGQLEDVAGLHLVAVVLEAPVPVLRHLADVVAQHRQNPLDRPPRRSPAAGPPARRCRSAP